MIDARLTPEFLETLRLLAKDYGWSGDYHEVFLFVQNAYRMAGYQEETIAAIDLKPTE